MLVVQQYARVLITSRSAALTTQHAIHSAVRSLFCRPLLLGEHLKEFVRMFLIAILLLGVGESEPLGPGADAVRFAAEEVVYVGVLAIGVAPRVGARARRRAVQVEYRVLLDAVGGRSVGKLHALIVVGRQADAGQAHYGVVHECAKHE